MTDALDDIRYPSSALGCGAGELIYVWRAHLPAARGSAGRTADSVDLRPQARGVRGHGSGGIVP